MNLSSPTTLLLAGAVTSPALYQAFWLHEMDPTTAMFRYLVAVPVCGLMLALLHNLTDSYRQKQVDIRIAARREADAEAAEAAELESFDGDRRAA